jgi:GT2 family glycosyltransferase
MAAMSAPEIRAVVANYEAARFIEPCVRSLRAQGGPRLETVLVDNASRDGSAGEASRLGVRCIALPANRGLAAAYNAGARGAEAPFLLFMNSDMRLNPGCAAELIRPFRERRELLATDPHHFSWEGGRVTHGALGLRKDEGSSFAALPGVQPCHDPEAGDPVEVPWGCAGALLVARDRFEALGGFDPSFFLYQEDVDLCLRGWLRGWPTLHVPSATLRHFQGASHGPGARHTLYLGRPLRYRLACWRIGVSSAKNAQRVALKILEPGELAGQAHRLARAWLRALARGRLGEPAAGIAGLLLNVLELKAVLADRRRARATAQISPTELVARFTRPRAPA